MDSINIPDLFVAIGGLLSALLLIGGIIVKLTKSTKDDEVFEKIEGAVKPVLDNVTKPKP